MHSTKRTEELNQLANRAQQLASSMSHGAAVEAAVDEAISFGWEKKADRWHLVSIVSTLLSNLEINGGVAA